MLEVRTSVMREEYQIAIESRIQSQKDSQAKEESLILLSTEKDDCLARLHKVSKEMQLIDQFLNQEKETLNKMN